MPIHDQGYRRYGGTRAAVGRAWQVMTRAGVMSVVTKRVFMGMMLFAWVPFIVRAVQIYVSATFTQASFLAPKGETFREFLLRDARFLAQAGDLKRYVPRFAGSLIALGKGRILELFFEIEVEICFFHDRSCQSRLRSQAI